MNERVRQATSSVGFRQKRLRRTNVYIAEYILMLMLFGGFIGMLTSLWYTFFGLLVPDASSGYSMVNTAVSQISFAIATGCVGYLLYIRVTGEELHNPAVTRSKARTVFLTIWLIGAVLTLLTLVVAALGSILGVIVGTASDTTQSLVGTAAPSLFAIATLGYGIWLIVKRSSRSLAITSGIVLASLATVLVLATTITLLVRKNDLMPKTSPRSTCSYGMVRSSSGGCKPDYTRDSIDSLDYNKYNSYN